MIIRFIRVIGMNYPRSYPQIVVVERSTMLQESFSAFRDDKYRDKEIGELDEDWEGFGIGKS